MLQLNFINENNAYDFLSKIKNLKYLEIINKAKKNDIKYFEITQSKLDQTMIEISDVVFSQKINEISDVITSPLGYHIVTTKEIRPSKTKTLNESRENIIENLKVNYYSEYLEDLLERIDEDLLNNYTINEIASKYFKGGGHSNSAGGIAEVSVDETIIIAENIIKPNVF